MGENPPLSEEEIMAINTGRTIRLESGAYLGTAQVTVEFLNPPTAT